MSKVRQRRKGRRSRKPVHPPEQPPRSKEHGASLKTGESKQIVIAVGAGILIATVIAYWGVWRHDFVNLDDNEYVTENSNVQAGLSLEGVGWAFTTSHASNWHPLTWLSHMLDCEFYGPNPAGHHLTNLIFHAANALLVFWVFKLMTGDLWRSGFVAGLFALHPLHVESVAWVSERKDVLSTFFWLLTMMGYVRYVQVRRVGGYVAALLAFGMGLMAKPMLVSLPFVLLLLDFWPLERLRLGRDNSPLRKTIIRLIKEKVPFFVLSGVSCIATVYAQQSTGAVKGLHMLALKYRIGNAIVSYAGYISKMFVPVNLAAYYPHPGDGLAWGKVAGAGLVLVFIFACVIIWGRRRGWLVTGWLWYVGTLVPVVGLVQVGAQAMADRYTYVPLIGLFVIIAWGVPELVGKWEQRKAAVALSGAAVMVVLMVCTHRQAGYWRNSIALFEHAIAATGENYHARYNLASAYAKAGRIDKAVEHNMEAVRLEPESSEAHHNLGVQLFKQGRIDDAIGHYKEAIRLDSGLADTHNNLGVAFEMRGRFGEAVKCYTEAISLRPDYANAHFGLASALAKQGKKGEAIKAYREVLRIEPGHVMAQQELEKLLKSKAD